MSRPHPDTPARGLLLDIGGIVLDAGPRLVNRLAKHDDALGRYLAPLGGTDT